MYWTTSPPICVGLIARRTYHEASQVMNRPIPSAATPRTPKFLPDLLLQESWQRSCCCPDFMSQENFKQTPFSDVGSRSSVSRIRSSTLKRQNLQDYWIASTRFTARTLKISIKNEEAFRSYLSAHLPPFSLLALSPVAPYFLHE